MERITVTTLVRGNGGKIWSKGDAWTVYELPSDELRLEIQEMIPFLALCTNDYNGQYYLTVWFDRVKAIYDVRKGFDE